MSNLDLIVDTFGSEKDRAELAALKAENARLRAELAKAQKAEAAK